MPTHRDLPYANCNFHVDIEGVTSGGFQRVDMEPLRVPVIRYRDGANPIERTAAGLPEPGRMVLERGVTGDPALFSWWSATRDGNPTRCTISIMLLDEQRQPVLRWVARQGWPVSYGVSTLDARGEEPLRERVEVVFEDLRVE
jgi:phage tail-like protein